MWLQPSPMKFSRWEHTATETASTVLLPDGCRDVLVWTSVDGIVSVHQTDWEDRARTVTLTQGESMIGYRMAPGVSVDLSDFDASPIDASSIASFLDDVIDSNAEHLQIIEALAGECASVREVARLAGVSTRTLQRRFKTQGLPKPEFWVLLSRVRRAGGLMLNGLDLAEAAATVGFSDQAHMSREFKRWFSVSPKEMMIERSLADQFNQSSLGAWNYGVHM